MGTQVRNAIQFVLNGRRYELTRAEVEVRLVDVAPDAIRKHAVKVNGTWFPAIQVFEVATGIPRSEFISHTARRHLATLGFEIAGQVESRSAASSIRASSSARGAGTSQRGAEEPPDPGREWHAEANVQAALVIALAGEGWRILSVANTATKEHGIDVVAASDDQTVGIEVKGYPSRAYADPARAGEVKRSNPSTQAGHWYSQAVLAAMRLRGKKPQWRSVVALPDCQRYRDLHAETAGSLAASGIEVWWVDQAGAVHRP